MKIFIKILMLFLLVIFVPSCAKLEVLDGGTKLYNSQIYSWEVGTNNVNYLNTSVVVNFDEINILNIDKITFELYQDNEIICTATSQNQNLENLLKTCAKFWDKTEETYDKVTGKRVLCCAFSYRENTEDNGFWVKTKCTIKSPEMPNKLKIKLQTGKIEYQTMYSAI